MVKNYGNTVKIRAVVSTIAIVSIFNLGCPENTTPVVAPLSANCDYPLGNRNYKWRLDTVAWFPSVLGGIHAFSDSDVYLMGYIGEGKPPYRIFVGLHWNGSQWTSDINGSYDNILHFANDVAGDNNHLVSVGYWAIGNQKAGLAEYVNSSKTWKGYQFQTPGSLRNIWTDGNGYYMAVGDSGMVYSKDGYTSDWIYQKVNTDFSFYKITGTSKNEIFSLGYKTIAGTTYSQIWKYNGTVWNKILDDYDSSGMIINIPEAEHIITDIYAFRCLITDSLRLYVVGRESNIFFSKGSAPHFVKTNLTNYGLYLNALNRSAQGISGFNINDIWVYGVRFTIYHWNGVDFQQLSIPGIPDKNLAPDYSRIKKTSSGKIFFPMEISSQVYVVAQGTPF
jgi:hypothetical protein